MLVEQITRRFDQVFYKLPEDSISEIIYNALKKIKLHAQKKINEYSRPKKVLILLGLSSDVGTDNESSAINHCL